MMQLPKLKLPEKKEHVRRPMGQDPPRRYFAGSFLDNIRERLKHRGERIRVDIWMSMEVVGGEKQPIYHRDDCWTEASSDELHKAGYLPGVRVPGYDSIQWWRQPVYVRVLNFQQFNIHVKNEQGQYIYSQDTPSTLNDEMNSNATKDFIKAMFKTTLPTMDVQKIIMIGILGVGAIFGLMMMGVI